jgi:threonine dehydrogenase-like Zn-dependent dehydrogenase
VRLEEVAEPDAALGSVLVEALAVGICGTDAEIASGGYGWAPLQRAPDDIKVIMEFAQP